MTSTEHVVLLDAEARAVGAQPKVAAHSRSTHLHLAFSCHVVDQDGRVLLTRRAADKRTWPGVWTNACCGHPQLGETLRGAVERRLRSELNLAVKRVALAVPDFTYRAAMDDGTVEHERCPVLVVEVKGELRPDPAEVGEVAWACWDEVRGRAARDPASLSPWSVLQIAELDARGIDPARWLGSPGADLGQALLDQPIELGRAVDPAAPPRALAAGAIETVGEPVADVLRSFLAVKAASQRAIDPAMGEVVDEVVGLVEAGGKRLRPAFTYWGHRATGEAAHPGIMTAAAAVELLHTFALLHDDVMDRSATRRGRPSAHAALAARHADLERLGDSGWFGSSAAILAGDLVYVWADELFEAMTADPSAVGRARRVFTTLREEVIAGQHLDLVLAADPAADEQRAGKVALLKSARYTVTRPLLLGAALAEPDAGARVAPALQAYGDAIGLAFQLRDDVLGLFGDPATTGKSDLDDLHEGKRTVLVLRALRLADARGRFLLTAALGNPDLDEAGADAARQVVAESGALASVEALIRAEHRRGLEAIADLPEPSASALVELADLAIRRST